VNAPPPGPAAKRKRPWWLWAVAAVVALLVLGSLFGEDDEQLADRAQTTTAATAPAPTPITTEPAQTLDDARAAVAADDYRQAVSIARDIDDASLLHVRRLIANRLARRVFSALRAADRPRAQTLLRQADRYPTTALTRRARANYRAARDRAAQRAQARRDAAAQRRRDAAAQRAAEEAAQAPPAQSDGCDPNYSGCVPIYPPDVNCPEVAGPVDSLGSDPHGLDRDNDGVACE
jgi:hypothetical protein